MPSEDRIWRELRRVFEVVEETGRPAALVGSMATRMYGPSRKVRDVDIVMSVSDEGAAREVLEAFQEHNYKSLDGPPCLPGLILLSPGLFPEERVGVDVMFQQTGAEERIALGARGVDLFPGGEYAKVAQFGDLIALKAVSLHEVLRPKDWGDLESLLSVAREGDVERAIGTVDAMVQRHPAFGTYLPDRLEHLVETFAPSLSHVFEQGLQR